MSDFEFIITYLQLSGVSDIPLIHRMFLSIVFKWSLILFSLALFFFVTFRRKTNSNPTKSVRRFFVLFITAILLNSIQPQFTDTLAAMGGKEPSQPSIMNQTKYENYLKLQAEKHEKISAFFSERIKEEGLSSSLVGELRELQKNSHGPLDSFYTETELEEISDYLTAIERHKLIKNLYQWLGLAICYGLLYYINNVLVILAIKRYHQMIDKSLR